MKKVIGLALAGLSVLSMASCINADDIYNEWKPGDLSPNAPTKHIFLQQEGVIYNSKMPVFIEANVHADVNMQGYIQQSQTNYATIYNQNKAEIDVVVYDQFTVERDAMTNGIFADLTPYINNEYAPNLAKFFAENPDKKEMAVAQDGKIYGIPFYTDGLTAKAWFVRMDWVEILAANHKLPAGLEPTKESLDKMTVEQYEALLKAFKDNAKLLTDKNTIYPYFDRDSEFAVSELASLWNATADYYLDGDKVVYGAVQPEFKTAVENMARWSKDGLLDPQLLNNENNNEDLRQTYFSTNQGATTHDWLGTTFGFNDPVYEGSLPENFELVCILPPTRKDGTKHEATARKIIGNVTAINAKTNSEDEIKQLVKWIDYFFSAEGQEVMNFGIENEHFTKNGEEYVFTDKILNDNATALGNLYSIGSQLQSAGVQNFAYEKAWMSEEAYSAMTLYGEDFNGKPVVDQEAYNALIYPTVKLDPQGNKDLTAAKSAVKVVYDKWMTKWIITNKTTSISTTEWNQFVTEMNNAGVNTIVSVLQAYVDSK